MAASEEAPRGHGRGGSIVRFFPSLLVKYLRGGPVCLQTGLGGRQPPGLGVVFAREES